MNKQQARDLQEAAYNILQAALTGPYLPENHSPNLANWVGAGTTEWLLVMTFKRGTDDRLWFCHVDMGWQQLFLMMVAMELLYTTHEG